jgi:ribosomal protein L11 methylase PrmA
MPTVDAAAPTKAIRQQVARVPGSFRDPCGGVYVQNGQLFRTVNASYARHYEHLHHSGLLKELWEKGWMIPFTEESVPRVATAWKTLQVPRISFISYPYEWSFSQLRAAALLTLDIQAAALNKGMTLKDASAYNVQFEGTTALFIDCLSLEMLEEGAPWIAYAQFCRHFLAPLVLTARVHLGIPLMLSEHIDGIPLDMASAMLPLYTQFSPGIQLHIHMHARMQRSHGDGRVSANKTRKATVTRSTLLRLVESLRALVEGLNLPSVKTDWGDYYTDTNYSPDAFEAKRRQVSSFLDGLAPTSMLDVGANRGTFSRLRIGSTGLVIAADMDPLAVERHYNDLVLNKTEGILPLVIDLANPSPSLGWHNQERSSFLERCNVDVVLALALIHHLSIRNNIPLEMSARLFSKLGRHLILEFVPKEDSQVQRLLATRRDIFRDYTLEALMTAFAPHFTCVEQRAIPGSARTLLRFDRKASSDREPD